MNARYFIYITLLCAVASYEVESAALNALKGAAKTLTEKVGDAADKVQPVAKTGGVRQTALHAGVDLAFEKGIEIVGAKYPAVKIAGKLAKPALNKVHNKINTLFNKSEADVKNTAETAAEPAANEVAEKDSDKTVESQAAPSDNSAKQNQVEEKQVEETSSEEKKDNDESATEKSDKDEKKVENENGKEKKKGVLGKLKSLVHGDKEPKDAEAKVTSDTEETKKEEPKKEGVLSKLGSLVTGDKNKGNEKEEDKKEEKKAAKKE